MDGRNSLKSGTQLNLSNQKGNSIICVIERELGRGSSCIVYEGSYYANTGDKKLIRIKECYPYGLRINRDGKGSLIPVEEDNDEFTKAKDKFVRDFSLANCLFYTDGLYDSIVNNVDIYTCNNSNYIVSTYSTRNTLAENKPKTIKECIEIISQIAKVIEKIHNAGYLYLDIKPSNILFINDGINNRVQLFDFDSLIPYDIKNGRLAITDQGFRLSYSKGFAAIELQLSKLKCIGPATDIFSIGALFYYLLYGKTPTVLQCESDSCFTSDGLYYGTDNCDDRLLETITDFFHHTLASYYKDRYQTMAEAIDKLTDIRDLADDEKKRFFASKLYKEDGFVGRESDMNRIDEFLNSDSYRCLFVSGIGGIGKSSLIRQYLYRNRDIYECLYLVFHGSICETINDDVSLRINKVRKADVEKEKDYYNRKINELRSLVTKKTVLVIDNYEGELNQDFFALLNLEWRVVIVTRQSFSIKGSMSIEICRIKDQAQLRVLFQYYLGRLIDETNRGHVDRLINRVDGHTLVLELIAKQIASSHMSVDKALELVEANGFSQMALETVDYEKDSVLYADTIGNIIDALFSVNNLSNENRIVLKVISILGIRGMKVHQLCEIMEWSSFQCFNELCRDGWIKIDQDTVTMHPIIQEAVSRWNWEDEYIVAAKKLLTYFYIEIRIETTHNDYPAWLKNNMLRASENLQNSHDNVITKKITEAFSERIYSRTGIIGEVLRARHKRLLDDAPADTSRISSYLLQAKSIIDQCKHIKELNKDDSYTHLLYETILNTPRYNDEYILSEAKEIFEKQIDSFVLDGTSELLEDCDSNNNNPITIIQLLKLVSLLYAENGDYESAEKLIAEAWRIAKKSKKRRQAMAHYYDLVSEYYDIKLGGAYDAESAEEKRILEQLRENIEKCMHYSKKIMKMDGFHLYIKNSLAMITIMIRSNSSSTTDISKRIDEVKELIREYTLPYASVRFQYYMVCAWYYALIEQDLPKTQIFINTASELYDKICPSTLAKIDCLLIPVANMYLELKAYMKSIDMLMNAHFLCEHNMDVSVYKNRDIDIWRYIMDVVHKEKLDKTDEN